MKLLYPVSKAFCFFVLLSMITSSATALEKLTYSDQMNARERLVLQSFFKGSSLNDFKIAKVDLNNDGLNEFVIKKGYCEDYRRYCDYYILADTDNDLIPLGHIQAYYLAAGTSGSNNVRDLMVYKNKRNDYAPVIYSWDAKRRSYQDDTSR